MKKATIQLEALTCPSCVQKIEGAVKSLDGVDKDSIEVMFNSSRVKVDFNEEVISIDDIVKEIDRVGYNVLKSRAK